MRWLLLGMILLSLQSCYVVKQGVGQFRLHFSQIPLEEAIELEQNEEYKQLLAAVPKIKQYATEQLGLKATDNYSGYIYTEEKGVAHVVTASHKTRLEPYTWWFPIVGSVPYRGYFNRAEAERLEDKLQKKGLDTWMFVPISYSTLGWFKDPLTTPMLKNGYYYLVSTLIHEMVHSTLYVKGEGDFNEQLASFVEEKGAIGYFEFHGLLTGDKRAQIEANKAKRRSFYRIIDVYRNALTQLYASGIDEQEILMLREEQFRALTREVRAIYPDKPVGFWEFNNARLLQYHRYREDSALLQEFWQRSNRQWTQFWILVNEYVKHQGWSS